MNISEKEQSIEQRSIVSLKPSPHNARTHSASQIRQIAGSIKQFGFTNPVLIDETGMILAGHGRVRAAEWLGWSHVPVLCFTHMTATEKRAYILADNKLAEHAGWDQEILAIELQHLLLPECDIDLSLTGFSTAEADMVILGAVGEEEDQDGAADQVPESDPARAAVSRVGDLWQLGRHRLLVGDAREAAQYHKLMGNHRAQMIFTDPPYNVPIHGHVCGTGKVRHEDFAMASGEMSETQFIAFLTEICHHMTAMATDGALHFICMDWRHAFELLTSGRSAGMDLKNICVWNKSNGGMGSLYRSKHELVFLFKSGTGAHVNNIELGRHGRYRTNVWDYAGVNSLSALGDWSRDEALAAHPTVKPVQLVADAILDCSQRGAWILDPFLGSGTTIIAAERTGRSCAGLEISPRYADTAIRRWQAYTGDQARCAGGNVSFSEREAMQQDAEQGGDSPVRAPLDHNQANSDNEKGNTDV